MKVKEFGAYARAVTERLKGASLAVAEKAGREVRYLASSSVCKEDVAQEIAQRDGITRGLVRVLTCAGDGAAAVPCRAFHLPGAGDTLTSKEIKLRSKDRNIAGLQLSDLLAHPLKVEALIDRGRLKPGSGRDARGGRERG